jgi:aryl hydrocarbon receptor nuclear translocator-like protein 1
MCTYIDRRYSVIQCTGYLKPWTQANECHNLSSKSLDQGDDSEDNGVGADSESTNNGSCLVAVGRIINNLGSASILSDLVKPPCFTSKHTIDGKFLSVDQRYRNRVSRSSVLLVLVIRLSTTIKRCRVTYIVGYLPQELLGTSMYEYFHQDDISRLVDIHKATLQECKPKNTEVNCWPWKSVICFWYFFLTLVWFFFSRLINSGPKIKHMCIYVASGKVFEILGLKTLSSLLRLTF